MTAHAAGRDLTGDEDGFTFDGKLRVVRAAFDTAYRQGNGRAPVEHRHDQDALIALVFDESAGRVDVARVLVEEIFAAGFGSGTSFFECWIRRAAWKEQGWAKHQRPISQDVRQMLTSEARRTAWIARRLERQRNERFVRRFA